VILGILDRNHRGRELKQELLAARRVLGGETSTEATVWSDQHLAFCSIPLQAEPPQSFANPDETIVVTFDGKIHNTADLAKRLGLDHKIPCSGEILAHLYRKYREDFLDYVNGKFAFALWDKKSHRLILGRDRLGIQPLFYFDDGKRFIFSSSSRALAATGWVNTELNRKVVLQYLLYCYNPSDETFWRHVYKLPAGHLLSLNGSTTSLKPYWRLSFAETRAKTEEQYREEISELMEDAIRIRLEPDRPPGIFLSGGTDSSAIVSLTSRMWKEPLHTYSFRCEGRSYDESPYARFVAQRYGTRHTEIAYSSDRVSVIAEAVEAMDEPFCDIGIEIGTYLLGQAAKENVSYVLSGEGGDELFAGHPVYVADKLAAVVDRLPRALMTPLLRLLQKIPDSDQKKDIKVKLKRFAYSLSFPPELLSHRWRVYYMPEELQELCTGDLLGPSDIARLFAVVLKQTEKADGPDQLSRSLQVDYHTLVDFYLRRLGLLRAFSLESHLPLLDHRLVEYAAKIPSYLKIRRFSDTKYIYKKVLENLLPREILYDRPKLGHSVPMKNWLRDNTKIRRWVEEVLSEGPIKDSGFFRLQFIQRLMQEHTQRTHNHSHRLWALVVLGLWLRKHFRK
jgi:asparagine synthase (glutamine-hydrolysing)